MSVVYLIRHGQASFGKEDYDLLSPLGEEQAQILGKSMVARIARPPLIIAGTMKRHHQTRDLANLTEKFDDYESLETADWNEYDHQQILGKLDERLMTAKGTKEALKAAKDPKKAFAKYFADATARWQSGLHDDDYSESWTVFKNRIKKGLELTIQKAEKHETVFVFTSGGPISLVTLHLLGLADEQMLAINWTLANCGVTKLVKSKNRLFLSTMNDHSHFDFPDQQHLITYK